MKKFLLLFVAGLSIGYKSEAALNCKEDLAKYYGVKKAKGGYEGDLNMWYTNTLTKLNNATDIIYTELKGKASKDDAVCLARSYVNITFEDGSAARIDGVNITKKSSLDTDQIALSRIANDAGSPATLFFYDNNDPKKSSEYSIVYFRKSRQLTENPKPWKDILK